MYVMCHGSSQHARWLPHGRIGHKGQQCMQGVDCIFCLGAEKLQVSRAQADNLLWNGDGSAANGGDQKPASPGEVLEGIDNLTSQDFEILAADWAGLLDPTPAPAPAPAQAPAPTPAPAPAPALDRIFFQG